MGSVGNGISIMVKRRAAVKYHPNMAAPQKQPPAPMTNFSPSATFPSAMCQNAPAANPNPMVAATKMRKKTRLVRVDAMRKTKDSTASVRA